jgi:hypothetical protein
MEKSELTYKDAEDAGIDLSMVAACKKIRSLAKLDRLRLDKTEHRSGLNRHLFDYIRYCGKDELAFIREYLQNLQPYMIQRRKDQETEKGFLCVVDNLYRVSVYIKPDTTQFDELVISFHEDNRRGIARTNDLIPAESGRIVPVFADCVESQAGDRYGIRLLVQRGMMVLPVSIAGRKCQDVFLVPRDAIDAQLLSYCNDYIKDLYTSDLDLDFDSVSVFSVLQQISFTSYGRDTFSSVSLLIDSVATQKDAISRPAADMALVTFVQNLKLTKEQQEELMGLLETKYAVTSIRGIDLILTRIRENLCLVWNEQQQNAVQEAPVVEEQNENIPHNSPADTTAGISEESEEDVMLD